MLADAKWLYFDEYIRIPELDIMKRKD